VKQENLISAGESDFEWAGEGPLHLGEQPGVAGGSGAGPGRDGVDVIETDATNCMNLPAEALEMEAPIRLHRVALRQDSGGAGEYRGGLGLDIRVRNLVPGRWNIAQTGRKRFPAWGLWGGGQGGRGFRQG